LLRHVEREQQEYQDIKMDQQHHHHYHNYNHHMQPSNQQHQQPQEQYPYPNGQHTFGMITTPIGMENGDLTSDEEDANERSQLSSPRREGSRGKNGAVPLLNVRINDDDDDSEHGKLISGAGRGESEGVTVTVQRNQSRASVGSEIRAMEKGDSSDGGGVGKKVHWFKAFLKFVGPGFMVGVGYLDPGNWATDLAGMFTHFACCSLSRGFFTCRFPLYCLLGFWLI
jgi:hypothetical protein